MKLLIDIPEDVYKSVKETKTIHTTDYDIVSLYRATKNATPYEEKLQGEFECRMKIKDVISMLLEFDMNEKATIHTTDEYKENNIVISITDTRGKEE